MIRTITAGVFLALASLGLARHASATPAHAAAGVEQADQFINVHGSVNRPGYGGRPLWHGQRNYRRGHRYDYFPPWRRYYNYRPRRPHHHGGYRGHGGFRGYGGYREDRGYRGYDQPRRRNNTRHFRKNGYRNDASFIIIGPGKIILR